MSVERQDQITKKELRDAADLCSISTYQGREFLKALGFDMEDPPWTRATPTPSKEQNR